MKIKLSQIKSKKCHCGMWCKEDGVECEACPLDSSFSKIHWAERGYFCKIDDFKRGLIEDQEIDLPTEPKDAGDYQGFEDEYVDFCKALLKYLEIENVPTEERKIYKR